MIAEERNKNSGTILHAFSLGARLKVGVQGEMGWYMTYTINLLKYLSAFMMNLDAIVSSYWLTRMKKLSSVCPSDNNTARFPLIFPGTCNYNEVKKKQ